jgi:hypothetical protein
VILKRRTRGVKRISTGFLLLALSAFVVPFASCRSFDRVLWTEYTATFQEGVSGYSGTTDAHVLESIPDNNTGGNDLFEICRYFPFGLFDDKYAFISFDVSSIPAEAEVISATLEVYFIGMRNGTTEKDINCHRVTASFTEGNGTGIDGQAVPGVTWNTKSSYDGTILDSKTVGDVLGFWYSFDITAAAQVWVNAPAQNFGVLLKQSINDWDINNPSGGTKQFASSEYATVSLRPKLTITYREGALIN